MKKIIKRISKMDFKKGFTLVEMLVVISIIGILAALTLISFSTSQKQARDTRRKSDLKQYQTALENFANNKNGFYPSKTTATDVSSLCSTLGISGSCPIDPKSATYTYYYLTDGSGAGNDAAEYVLWATVESAGGYWVVCSTGKNGFSTTQPASPNCPI